MRHEIGRDQFELQFSAADAGRVCHAANDRLLFAFRGKEYNFDPENQSIGEVDEG